METDDRGVGSVHAWLEAVISASAKRLEVLLAAYRWVRCRLRSAMWRQWKTQPVRRAALANGECGRELASNTAGSGLGCLATGKGQALRSGSHCLFQIARTYHAVRRVIAQLLEPPCTDPHVRWCGRGERVTAAPMPIKK